MTAEPSAGRPLRAALLVTLGLALFVSSTVGIAALVWREPSSAESIDDPAAARLGALEEGSRTVSISPASMTLPDDPYALYPDPMPLRGVLDGVFSATAVVHPRAADRQVWTSAVLVGRLPGTVDRDLEAQGATVLRQLSQSIFNGHPTHVEGLTTMDRPVGGQPGVEVSAKVTYSVPGLPSRYDVVAVRLVGLDDGTAIVAASSVPDDTPEAIARQAAQSLDSLKIS